MHPSGYPNTVLKELYNKQINSNKNCVTNYFGQTSYIHTKIRLTILVFVLLIVMD
jgi:hypothetical protein